MAALAASSDSTSITAEPSARFTCACTTPGTWAMAASARATHEAQLSPSTSSATRSVAGGWPAWVRAVRTCSSPAPSGRVTRTPPRARLTSDASRSGTESSERSTFRTHPAQCIEGRDRR